MELGSVGGDGMLLPMIQTHNGFRFGTLTVVKSLCFGFSYANR